jgi:hypothetical protein
LGIASASDCLRFRISKKGLYPEVPLDPFEELFHLAAAPKTIAMFRRKG